MTDSAPKPPSANPGVASAARATMEQSYQTARDATGKAIDRTREATLKTAKRAAQGIDDNPVAVLAGGIAIGMLAGAFLPVTRQERKLVGPVAKQLTDTASGAAQAAKQAGLAELDTLGISKKAANDQVGRLIGGVLQALSSAGDAAAASAKK